jgi:hypothetical protein
MGFIYIRVDSILFCANLTRTAADLPSTILESSSILMKLASIVVESPWTGTDLAPM